MNRGQAHTLEAITAALLLIGGLIFALQATAVTPLSASTSNQHIENQQRAMAEDLVSISQQSGTLEEAVLDWNETAGAWNGAEDRGYFVSHGPENEFGHSLNETFLDSRIAVNVAVHYREPDGGSGVQPLVYMGTPSDNAASATGTVPIHPEDQLPSGTTVAEAADNGEFYADESIDGHLHTLTEVEVTIWRM